MTLVQRILLITAISAAIWAAYRAVPHSFILEYAARIERFPEDDAALEQWLAKQPDVVSNTVSSRRVDGKLHLTFIRCCSPWTLTMRPLDLKKHSRRLGYELAPGDRFEPVFNEDSPFAGN